MTERFVAVVTVRDWGAAQVAREKLDDAGIPVELKPLGQNPYFGTVSAAEIEVRVPSSRLADAERQLAQREEETEALLLSEAGVPPEDYKGEHAEDEAADARGVILLPKSEERPLKVSWALVLSWLLPFPAGCFYARAWPLGWLLVGLFAGGAVAPLVFRHAGDAAFLAVFAKAADLVLAPILVVKRNRRLARAAAAPAPEKEPHGAQP